MLKEIAFGIAAGLLFAGPAIAQTVRLPVPEQGSPLLLVKHDKEEHGNGRKLGHFKHQTQDDEDQDEHRNRRRSTSTPYGSQPRYYVPSPYYGPPGYGSSYP